jgi:hypothetical protein
MFKRPISLVSPVALAALLLLALSVQTSVVAGQSAGQAVQVTASPAQTPAQVANPAPARLDAGAEEAVRLLHLMDTDQNGKISKAEYMKFMEAEFESLDVNKDGELDLKELEKSQLQATHHDGRHR